MPFSRRMPPTERNVNQQDGVVCSQHHKRRETVSCCQDCDVTLCIIECFAAYHTKKNY